ncbi:MAG: tetratricopeptide repeat protein [Planctomycetota bacterium]
MMKLALSYRNRCLPFGLFLAISLGWFPAVQCTGQSLDDLSDRYDQQYDDEEWEAAVVTAKQGLAVAKRDEPDETIIAWLDALGDALLEIDDKELEAVDYYTQSLSMERKLRGNKHVNVAIGLRNLANAYYWAEYYEKSLKFYQQAAALFEQLPDRTDYDISLALNGLGNCHVAMGEYSKGEAPLARALKLLQKDPEVDSLDIADYSHDLARCLYLVNQCSRALPLYERSLSIYQEELGSEHVDSTETLAGIGDIYYSLNKYEQAHEYYKQAQRIRETELGPEDAETLWISNVLASLQRDQGRYAEAASLFEQVIEIRERTLGADHFDVSVSLSDLAVLYAVQGQYAKSELLYQRALKILENQPSPSERDIALAISSLADVAIYQNKHEQAESLYKRAIARLRNVLSTGDEEKDVDLGWQYFGLGNVNLVRESYVESESNIRRALEIFENNLGPNDYSLVAPTEVLGQVFVAQDRYEEAIPLYEKAQKIVVDTHGSDHPDHAFLLTDIATLYLKQGNAEKGLSLIDQAITIRDRVSAAADDRANSYLIRAKIEWDLDERSDALADLRQSMSLAEQQRTRFSGGERQRAAAFSELLEPFETMIQWQLDIGDVGAALGAVERAKARSLLDELQVSGADLQAGRSSRERKQLQEQESKLQARVLELEKRFAAALEDSEIEKLTAELTQARQALYAHHEKSRSSSPVYRNLLSVGAAPPRLSQVRRRLLRDGDQLLVYYFGKEGGYLISMTRKGEKLAKLEIGTDQAATLGMDTGPLTADQLKKLLTGDEQGLLTQLRNQQLDADAEKKLAALARVLLPGDLLRSVSNSQDGRLLIVPDGPLALLPFETLVIDTKPKTSFLLDRGPPIDYGPSTAVMLNLSQRAASSKSDSTRVVTVGNPYYGPAEMMEDGTMLASLTTRSSYRAAGGRLSALPFSGQEAEWVASTFQKLGVSSRRFDGNEATEANIRSAVEGCQIVHFACHGLVDQSFGNFFGSLALSPGSSTTDPSNDGFLTLPEICTLDLKSCELAILSACDTNYGPQQQGEGVWSLSRGFLVAGSQRVVASSWLVDDEAAASIVSVFCSSIARAKAKGEKPDYAKALHEAKRWARKQSKWSNPYYWGTFVLVGPG